MKAKAISIATIAAMFLASCGGGETLQEGSTQDAKPQVVKEEVYDPMMDKGVGPITSVTLGEIDQAMVDDGKEKFETLCTACHMVEKRLVGPAMNGIMARRTPEWIMNMILDPQGMVKNNEAAKKLLVEYSAPMANQGLTEEEARNVLEYFRTLE